MNKTTHTDLRTMQRQFAAGLSSPGGEAALSLLKPLRGRPPRLAVYRQAYRARLVAALRSNYPVLHLTLGDDAFETLALAHLAERPSLRPSIRWFGEGLAAWLQDLPADSALHPALVDLARMEWALGTSFDAADVAPLAARDLAAVAPAAWPGLYFGPHPSVQCLKLDWAVAPIWRALTDDANADTGEPQALAHMLLVWRQGLDSRWRSVPDDEARLLTACLAGASVATLCEQAAACSGEAQAAAQVAGWLQRWLADGLLCSPT